MDSAAAADGGGGPPELLPVPELGSVLMLRPDPGFVALGKLALVGVSNMGEDASEEGTSNSLAPVDGFLWNEG